VLLGHLGREALATRDVPDLAIAPQQSTTLDRDAPPLGPLAVGEPSSPGCGFNLAFWGEIDNDRANAEYLDLAEQSGCEWIRLQFTWSDLEPTRGADIEHRLDAYDRVVDHARAIGLHLLVDVTHPPGWARPSDRRVPADPAAFGRFMSRLVAHFAGRVAAWQLWNEPNLIDETNGIIDPAGFLPLLRAGSEAIRAADPDALVVFPGLAPTSMMYDDWAVADDWYLEALLSLNNGEAARYVDVLGVQGYGAGNHPDTYWPGNLANHPDWTAHPEFYFRHVERLHTVMLDLGLGDIPIWITEMGWPAGRTADVYGYGAYVTPELQAAYLTRAYEIIRTEWHWVENAFVWHLNAAAYGGAESAFAGFSVTDADGSPRPAFDAIRTQKKRWLSEAAP
jgi:polysaccharide biosynthesis protein PslG